MPRPRPSPSPVFPPVSAVSDLPKSQARFSVRPVLEVAAKKGGPKGALQATIFFFHRLVVEKNKISGRQVLEEGPFFHNWVVEKNRIRVRPVLEKGPWGQGRP